jgi:mono/diheme cytochrome c family protein
MGKIVRWIGIVLGGIVVVIVLSAFVAYAYGSNRLAKAPEVPVRTVAIPSDAAALERGRHLAHSVTGCAACHGSDLGGKPFMEDPVIGTIAAPNLTAGRGGIAASYTVDDWVRAVQHGVAKDGRVLGGMPSNLFASLSDADMGAILAYVTSVPPVDRDVPERKLAIVGTILFGTVAYGDLPAVSVDHARVGGTVITEAVTLEYGHYLATIATCSDCHGEGFSGYQGPPGPPPGPDITGAGALRSWSKEDFQAFFRQGRRPNGELVSADMPWEIYAGLTDGELEAMWMYLLSLPGEAAR